MPRYILRKGFDCGRVLFVEKGFVEAERTNDLFVVSFDKFAKSVPLSQTHISKPPRKASYL